MEPLRCLRMFPSQTHISTVILQIQPPTRTTECSLRLSHPHSCLLENSSLPYRPTGAPATASEPCAPLHSVLPTLPNEPPEAMSVPHHSILQRPLIIFWLPPDHIQTFIGCAQPPSFLPDLSTQSLSLNHSLSLRVGFSLPGNSRTHLLHSLFSTSSERLWPAQQATIIIFSVFSAASFALPN